jgi:hypothetical protein
MILTSTETAARQHLQWQDQEHSTEYGVGSGDNVRVRSTWGEKATTGCSTPYLCPSASSLLAVQMPHAQLPPHPYNTYLIIQIAGLMHSHGQRAPRLVLQVRTENTTTSLLVSTSHHLDPSIQSTPLQLAYENYSTATYKYSSCAIPCLAA